MNGQVTYTFISWDKWGYCANSNVVAKVKREGHQTPDLILKGHSKHLTSFLKVIPMSNCV